MFAEGQYQLLLDEWQASRQEEQEEERREDKSAQGLAFSHEHSSEDSGEEALDEEDNSNTEELSPTVKSWIQELCARGRTGKALARILSLGLGDPRNRSHYSKIAALYPQRQEDLREAFDQCATDVLAIGIAYAAQQVDMAPRTEYDQPLDWIVTEEGAIKTR